MKQITILLLALTLTLTACGGGSGDSTTTASAKDLFSSWAEEGTGFVLDMTHGSFGTFGFTYLITGGAICDCSLTVGGTETSGNAVMSG